MTARTCAVAVIVAISAAGLDTVSTAQAARDLGVQLVGEMPTSRAAHQATLLPSGEVLVTGGCGRQGCEAIQASADVYQPDAGAFRPVAPMSTPRASHAAIALRDGRVLVAGGWTGGTALVSAELYDPARGRFTPAGAMNVARVAPAATLLADGRVLITGGEASVNTPLSSAEVFDPATSRFSMVGAMQTPRISHIAVPLADGRVFVAGGRAGRGQVLRSAEVFDPATARFAPAGDMTEPRHKHAAVRLLDGTVLILGGSDARDYRGRYVSTEVYDPAAFRFTAGPDMGSMRHKIRDAVVALPSGRVVVAGGAARPELYDPVHRRFTPSRDELSGSQMFATATLLRTGDVLVLGGYDEQILPSASVWRLRVR